jgi:7-cyano-7-deazaguanine synthase in queuosine biosynthesis
MEKQRMTRQEALKELENLTIDYGKRTEEEIERLDEAVDMAISALKADTVDRQSVIDSLYEWADHCITDQEAWHLRQVAGDIKSMEGI